MPVRRHLTYLVAALVLVAFVQPAAASDPRIDVDLQLVLAADASGSMSAPLRKAQREGFVAAFRDPRLHRQIASGMIGRIAVVYVEWSGPDTQVVLVPWRLVATASDAEAFAADMALAGAAEPGRTSISAALLFAAGLIAGNDYTSRRRVIDLSGNGVNSAGPALAEVAAALGDAGITVNCLVLPQALNDPDDYSMNFTALEIGVANYFHTKVRSGPGSFVMEVADDRDFRAAIIRKLVLEIASLRDGQAASRSQ
jgi:hypothetical protein